MRKTLLFTCVLLLAQLLLAQNSVRIAGVVIGEEDNLPVIGANVTIKGTTQGTITDFDGNFEISIPVGEVLAVSYIGYQTFEQKISGANNSMRIILKSDTYVLDEFVAIGYGVMKKSDLTGAVASVKADQLQKTPAAGLDQALQGRVAGVTVNANSGQPGAAAEIRIRGIGTINDSRPIYVVDGIIVSDIAFLSPNDIESTEILKDASATAIYGSRGANGVILITTKRGKSGKANISFNAYWGLQNRWRKLDLMKSKEYAETILKINSPASTIAYYNSDGFNAWMQVFNTADSPYFPLVQTTKTPDGVDYSSIETDWQDEVFQKNALIQNYHVSVEGGNEKDQYVFSASYFNQDGTIMGSNYERLTLRVNSSHQVRSWLKIGENLTFVNSTGRNAMHNSDSPGASILSAALAMAPWDPTHYPANSVNADGKDLSGQISASSNFKNVVNPFSMVENHHPENKSERWLGDIHLEITPLKGLMLRSAVSMDLTNNRNKSFTNQYQYSGYDKSLKNYLSSNMQRYRTLTVENILSYSTDFGKHSISAMVGQTTEQWEYYTTGGAGASILNPVESNWYLSKTTEDKTLANDGVDRTRMFSLLSRLHYGYDNRYMVTLNFRGDGTSKFPENPWGYFPSTALAWRLSEESFMKDIPYLDYLKLRAGWGRIGNEKISSTVFMNNVTESENVFTGYPFGANQDLAWGAALLTLANKNGKWETTEQWNVGVDFGFFNNLISGNVDFFVRDTKDMLLYVKAPAHVGNRYDPMANVGTVRNQGLEISLEHQQRFDKWNYFVSGNVSFIKNELTELNDGNPLYGDRTLSDKGLPLFTFWGYEYEGVYRTDLEAAQHMWNGTNVKAGDAKYKDISGPDGSPDGKIDDYDKTNLGNPFPWLTYGLTLGADYKAWDFQVFFQGVYGNKIYNAVRHRTEYTGLDATLSTTMRDVFIDYNDDKKAAMEQRGINWEELINLDGTIPNPAGSTMNKETSSRFIENGAYLRLKNLQIGYSLPRQLIEKANISRFRLYLSANNLFTITKYTGYDPEVGSGVDYGNYPQSRTFTFGVNVDF